MEPCGRIIVGALLAATTLTGCNLLRPNRPELPAVKKDPFKEDDANKAFTVPAIQKASFAPPDFPLPPFERSQSLPVLPVEPSVPRHDVNSTNAVKLPPLEKREPLAEAVQCVLENKHEEALRHLQAYDADTQDLFLRLLPALSVLSKKKMTDLSAAEVAVLHEQLHGLLNTLRPRTALAIDKACFCEWVKGYGNYKPLPEGHAFAVPAAGRPGELVQLYVELRNFTSEARNGAFETRLSSSVEICDGRGEQVWSYRFEDEKQPIRSRTQLHDWYNNYSFHVPKSLPPGQYRLTIQVADETQAANRRLARQTLEFRVAAAPPRAALK
jgi:hypothetical protein